MLEDRIILKENRVFVASNALGDVPLGNELGLGLYHLDTRFLSGYEMTLDGKPPILLSASVDRAYVATFQLVNPTMESNGSRIPRQTVSLRRTRFVRRGLHERIGLQNCNPAPIELTLELRFEADFKDIFAVRGYHTEPELGEFDEPELTGTGFRFRYYGRDGVQRETEVVFHTRHPGSMYGPGWARFGLKLAPHETFTLVVDVLPLLHGQEPHHDFDFDSELVFQENKYKEWNLSCTELHTDNELLDAGVLWRSREDIRILCDDLPSGLFPTAGIPWYAVPFGRDGLITSIQALGLNPDLARGTLRYLAEWQGSKVDEEREEEPGKIFHEIRFGELANLELIPHTPYYGTVDATPLFLVTLVELLDWTGDVELLTELFPNVMAALAWCDRFGDLDGDGFVEYQQHGTLGVRNQGWKDSFDSLTHRDGSVATLPAALVEVQGYVYAAKAGLARIFKRLGRRELAQRLEAEARELKRRFEQAFWDPSLGFYAQAVDGAKRQVSVVSSNPGHCLWSGISGRRHAAEAVARLMSPEMFSGWGIRTLSAEAVNYNPMSYHNGSVWPHDNSLIAAGFQRLGFREEAELVCRSVLEAGIRFADHRLPELYCGFARDRRFNSQPGEYLVSCSPQAWGSGSTFLFLTTLLGIRPDVLAGTVTIDPLDTPLYNRLHVSGMRIGEETIDFTVDRRRGGVRVIVGRKPRGLAVEHPS